MGLVYVLAGLGHFVATEAYMRVVPDYLPAHRCLVLLSGAAEAIAGLALLTRLTQRFAAWGIILLLVAVMPANVWMVQQPERWPGIPVWLLWLRLPLQGALIWWAHLYTRRAESTDLGR